MDEGNDISLEDRIRGVIYGQAVGDALGLGTEFLSRGQVRSYYPQGLSRYCQIVRDGHRVRWPVGAWTDDTDQMLCILDSLLQKGQVDTLDIARRIHDWVRGGVAGVGETVLAAVSHPRFLEDPQLASREVWEKGGRDAAANGALMRSSILGVWEFRDRDAVARNAAEVCRITHHDPRCVGSCVALCLAISSFLGGERDPSAAADGALRAVSSYDPRIADHFELAYSPDIGNLALDEPYRIGYTLKALGAGFWAVLHAGSFEEGLAAVIHQGGVADTNGAVAGSLLGARFGFAGIPSHLVEGLHRRSELETRVEELLSRSSGWGRKERQGLEN